MASPERLKTLQQGHWWERRAEFFLRDRGLKILERNFRCRLGEIDLVAEDGNQLVFVEVRYRRSGRHGSGAESVGRRKQGRIASAAALYLARHRRQATRVCRFDVISVSDEDGPGRFEWIRNAFQSTQGQNHA